jgi:hypothetical protein
MTGRSIELATGRRLPQDRLQPLEAAQSKREGYIMRCADSAVGRPPGLADRREVNGCPRLSCSLVGRAIGDDGRLSWCAAAAVTAHSTDSLHLSLICACIVWCCRTRTKATTRLCGASAGRRRACGSVSMALHTVASMSAAWSGVARSADVCVHHVSCRLSCGWRAARGASRSVGRPKPLVS